MSESRRHLLFTFVSAASILAASPLFLSSQTITGPVSQCSQPKLPTPHWRPGTNRRRRPKSAQQAKPGRDQTRGSKTV